MVSQFVAALDRPISRVRLENYRSANGSDLDMIVNYFHNLELSEALYPTLQAFEIALRNSVHLTLSQHFQNAYWFDTPGLYPPPPSPATTPWQEQAIQSARAKLTAEKKSHDADRIVAEMHLGFWHGLFNRPFENKLWRPNKSALVGQVFPLAPNSQRNRQPVWNRVNRIRILRNRVMHYEPIWHRARLADDHTAIVEALGWISPDMHDTIAMCDRFLVVHGRGRPELQKRIQAEIQKRFPSVPPATPE